jgi:hypothetical protein
MRIPPSAASHERLIFCRSSYIYKDYFHTKEEQQKCQTLWELGSKALYLLLFSTPSFLQNLVTYLIMGTNEVKENNTKQFGFKLSTSPKHDKVHPQFSLFKLEVKTPRVSLG